MFKKFTCDSITVPSCAIHNTAKGGDDQAIVSAFLIPLHNGIKKYRLNKKKRDVIVAINAAKSSFIRAKHRAIDSPLLKKDPHRKYKKLPNLAYLIPDINIKHWIRQLTAALVYDASKFYDSTIGWENIKVWSPDWVKTKGPATLSLNQAAFILSAKKELYSDIEALSWQNGWSAHPNPYPKTIYYFQVHFEADDKVIFKHKFYESYTWYSHFSASPRTIVKIKDKLSSWND